MITKSTKSIKEVPEHRDRLDNLLKIGDYIAYPSGNSLMIGMIKKLNPKMIGISSLSNKKLWSKSYVNKYPYDCVVIDGSKVTMYILKNSQ